LISIPYFKNRRLNGACFNEEIIFKYVELFFYLENYDKIKKENHKPGPYAN